MFWNLLANAVKFTPAGGSVTVDASSDGGHATVTVADTGIGMKPDFLPHMFERFSQADSSTTRRHGGLGLGLSISKSLIDMHGGSVEAHSEGPNRARPSRFACRCTRSTCRSRRSPTGACPATTPCRRATRPWCCAAPASSSSTTTWRGSRSSAPCCASTARSSHRRATPTRPSPSWPGSCRALVLCDIGLPHVDGYELLRRIREVSTVPAIALTAFARDEDSQKALEAGFVAYLAKPAEPAHIVAACARVIGSAAPAR